MGDKEAAIPSLAAFRCNRCRHLRRHCDKSQPACSRCVKANLQCNYASDGVADAGTNPEGPAASPSVPSSAQLHPLPPSLGSGTLSLPYHSPSTRSPENSTSTVSGDKDSLISPTSSGPDVCGPAPIKRHSAEQTDSLLGLKQDQLPTQPTSNRSEAPPGPPEKGSSTAAPAPKTSHRRKRNRLSCLLCHKGKVKCDKGLPCGRCKRKGRARECYYNYNKGRHGGRFPCPSAPAPVRLGRSSGSSSLEENRAIMSTWRITHKFRGSSHWRDLMGKIGELAKADNTVLLSALQGVATNACLANFTIPGNFPFGTPGAAKYYSRDNIASLIGAERDCCRVYIDTYIRLFDTVNPVLDRPCFLREVEHYWQDPHGVDMCWLSLFLMVLGLGCFADTEDDPTQATEFMMAAEACLMQTPFMFRPTFAVLQTLTIMTVAKQICNPTCWSIDSCWSLLGLLMRLAFEYGLPQETFDSPEDNIETPQQRDSRRRLWLTILYVDMKLSMCCGMPPLTRPDEVSGFEQMAEKMAESSLDSLQLVLYKCLPTCLAIMSQTNAKNNTNAIPYDEVLRYNVKLRQLMADAQQNCSSWLQRCTVDIFLRRTLMILHRPFALDRHGPTRYPESYWSSLECSLALLVHYRELWDLEHSQERHELVGRAFVLDFFSAALSTYVHLLREDAPLVGPVALNSYIPPRTIMLDTMKACIDIWDGERDKSVCWQTGYDLLVAVLDMLPPVE